MTFLLEEVKETISDFSHRTIKLFSLKMIQYNSVKRKVVRFIYIYIYIYIRMSLQLHDFTYIK